MQYSSRGGECENVLHFEFATAPTETELNQLGHDLVQWYRDAVRAQQSNEVFLNQIIITDLTTETGPQVVYTTDLPQQGDAAFSVMPSNVTVAISMRTGFRGRSNRGRSYWIGMVDENVTGDLITTGFADALQAAWEALLTGDFLTHNEALVIVSYCSGGAWRLTGHTSAVKTIVVDRTLDSQRRRLLGRGA
jgi:hypothetical protein